MQQSDAVFVSLAHADDPAAADGHARLADRGEGPEPVVVISRGDDLAVVLGRRVQIVVVGRQAGLGQAVGLRLR